MNIYFIYRKSQENLGSVKMRVFQMKEILENKFPKIDTIGIYSTKPQFLQVLWFLKTKNKSIIIFNKDAIDRVSLKVVDALRKKGIKVGIDVLDKDMNYFDYRRIDFLIASSQRQFRYLNSVIKTVSSNPSVYYIPHQADIRLSNLKPEFMSGEKNKKIFYFGEHTNIYIPSKYLEQITILPYRGTMASSDIHEMTQYQFQYCIRGPQQNTSLYIFKPITKLINSLYLGALPIISFDMEDAVDILGKKYPLTLREYSEAGFQELFELIRNADDETLVQSMKCMEKLRSVHGFKAVEKSFTHCISSLNAN